MEQFVKTSTTAILECAVLFQKVSPILPHYIFLSCLFFPTEEGPAKQLGCRYRPAKQFHRSVFLLHSNVHVKYSVIWSTSICI